VFNKNENENENNVGWVGFICPTQMNDHSCWANKACPTYGGFIPVGCAVRADVQIETRQ